MRGHRTGDLRDAAAMWSDPLVTRFIGGKASTEQQTWARITGYAGHWRLMGFGYWAITERETGTFAGEIGFADFKRPLKARMRDVPELGFALASRFRGRGYAREALEAVLRWGDVHLDSQRTVALVVPENAASAALLERFGYASFGTAEVNGAVVSLMERLSDRRG